MTMESELILYSDNDFPLETIASYQNVKCFNNPDELMTWSKITDIESNVIIELKELSVEDRILIRNIKRANPNTKCMLVAPEEYAFDAWKLNVFHFDELPLNLQKINRFISKQQRFLKNQPKTITFKTKEGLIRILLKDIIYVKASGNYSEFYLNTDKKLVQTKQLHLVEQQLCVHESFERLHRSIILNLDAIQKIEKQKIVFYKSKSSITVSIKLATRIKQLLLGNV